MRKYDTVGIGVPEALLPQEGVDLTRWAVVACDQFTSQPEYWRKAGELVGSAPSTLNMIYPEAYLGEPEDKAAERIRSIRESMQRYLDEGTLVPREGLIYVEREAAGEVRKGLVACLDLENYDYRKGAGSLIRATEGTILERIPPRVRIREGAKLELPHIMVLIDDPHNLVIGQLTENKDKLEKLYDFDLMMGSGRLAGYRVADAGSEKSIISALEMLAEPNSFAKKYGLEEGTPVLLFAMGDGNHSLATAKAIWEKTKETAPDKAAAMESPARFAMVELVNVHDEALVFEPIHRVVFEVADGRNLLEELAAFYSGRYSYSSASSFKQVKAAVDEQEGEPHKIGVIQPGEFAIIEITGPDSNLPVGSLQNFLDKFIEENGAREVDYVHGTEPVLELGGKLGNIGFYLPAMNKHELFRTVILDGALPRKTFSMGEAREKRFYMECRRIID